MSTVSCLHEGGLHRKRCCHGEDRGRKRCWVIKLLDVFLMVKSKSGVRTRERPSPSERWNLPCKGLIGHCFNHSIEGKDDPVHHPADLEAIKALIK